MPDIITRYKKYKKMTNVSIILASLVLALSINFIIFDGNNLPNSLKTSVLESENMVKSDLYLINNSGSISVVTNKTVTNVANITLSMIYNPENVSLSSAATKKDVKISSLSGETGINTLLIDFPQNTNLAIGEKIFTIDVTKKSKTSEQLNLINANFTDASGETYLFTTSGITF